MIITDELLKRDLTPEQFERFKAIEAESGFDEALRFLPDMGDDSATGFSCVGDRIKQLRVENGLTQNDLANILGLSHKEYWRYEQPNYCPHLLKLALIAVFYNVSLDWISGYTDEKKSFCNGCYNMVNGYKLDEFKDAKANGKVYTPHLSGDIIRLENGEYINNSGIPEDLFNELIDKSKKKRR